MNPIQSCTSSRGLNAGTGFWDKHTSFIRRLVPLLLGAISALGFAPFAIWPATLLSLTMLLIMVASATSLRQALAAGWWFGFGLGIGSLSWLAHAFSFQAAMPPWLGWGAVVLLSAYTALYWAFPLGVAYVAAQRASFIGFPSPAALAFMVAEWLRGVLLTGFAWNPLSAIWLDTPEIVGGAAIVGGLGLSGLTLLMSGLLAAAIQGGRWRTLLAAIFLAMAFLSVARRTPPPDTRVPVSVVQANVSQSDKWRAGDAGAQLQRYLALTEAPPLGRPRLVFWPEAAVVEPLDARADIRRAAAAALNPGDLLFTGAIGTSGDGLSNSVFVLNASGTILARYDKSHLVPFGEYLPFADTLSKFGLSRLVPGNADFVPGAGPQTLLVHGLKAGVSICYEITFPAEVADAADRPTFLFHPSNDAWFGFGGPEQHLAQARLRAVEEGLPIVRATPTGETAIIRSDGSIAARLPPYEASRLDAFLPAPGDPTLFALWGNLVPLGGGMIILLAGLLERLLRSSNLSRIGGRTPTSGSRGRCLFRGSLRRVALLEPSLDRRSFLGRSEVV